MPPDERPDIDYRSSLANERTFLSWIRTALGLAGYAILALIVAALDG